MERWQGRVAVVTGGCGGIGGAISQTLASHGMTVVACDKTAHPSQLADGVAAPSCAGGRVHYMTCDLRDPAHIAAVMQRVDTEHGGADVIVNGAGLAFPASPLEGATHQWREMWEVNVLGLSVLTQAAVRSMLRRGVNDGHVLNIVSDAGHRQNMEVKEFSYYAATKHAARVLTVALRAELKEKGSHIRVTDVSPGDVESGFKTAMFADDSRGLDAVMAEWQGKQMLTPADVADSVVFALSAPARIQINNVMLQAMDQ